MLGDHKGRTLHELILEVVGLKILTHTRLALTLVALLAAAFLLTACGGAPPTGWAGARVVDGVVFTGTSIGKVMALNAADGALKWQFPADKNLTSVYATPALANGILSVRICGGQKDRQGGGAQSRETLDA